MGGGLDGTLGRLGFAPAADGGRWERAGPVGVVRVAVGLDGVAVSGQEAGAAELRWRHHYPGRLTPGMLAAVLAAGLAWADGGDTPAPGES